MWIAVDVLKKKTIDLWKVFGYKPKLQLIDLANFF